MKKYIIALVAVGCAASVLAQGTVVFNNVNTSAGLRSPVYGTEGPGGSVIKVGNTTAGLPAGTQVYLGALLAGSGYWAQLYAANGSSQPEGSLAAAAPVTTFRTGTAAGYVTQQTVTLAGVPKDAAVATVQMRAWDNSSGLYPTWALAEVAWLAGTIAAGKSMPFDVAAIGGDLNAPPLLLGARSFNIYFVPEPSTFALLGLGALGLLALRRK